MSQGHFLFKSGTTMGTKCAPSYAILLMNEIKMQYLATRKLKPLVWWRYIDDIFIVWPHSRKEASSFTDALNSIHDTIKFTIDVHKTTANFLETTINKGKIGWFGK